MGNIFSDCVTIKRKRYKQKEGYEKYDNECEQTFQNQDISIKNDINFIKYNMQMNSKKNQVSNEYIIIEEIPDEIPINFINYQIRNNLTTKKHKNSSFLNGIYNQGSTCYINTALQAIKQIQFHEKSILSEQDSPFSSLLFRFFQNLNMNQDYSYDLQQIIKISNCFKKHQIQGGDSYLIILHYFGQIFSEIVDISERRTQQVTLSTNPFIKSLKVAYCDGLQCEKCSYYQQDKNKRYQYIEEFGFSLIFNSIESFEKMLSFYGEKYIEQYCQQCKSICWFITKKSLIEFPKFLIVKLSSNQSENIQSCQKQRYRHIFSFQNNASKMKVQYQIIGYCTYTGNHYMWSANYLGEWYLFNDNEVTETNCNLTNAYFLLLLNVEQNSKELLQH